MGTRCPDLLAIDDPIIAIFDRSSAQRCQITASGRLTEQLTPHLFAAGEYVDVTGITKGRGFQGVVRRFRFGGGRASHGGGWERKPGSIGMCEFPGKVYKGRKMPGHMGNVRRTAQNLQVVKVMPDDNVILVKGAIPGANGRCVIVRQAIKK